MKVKCTCKRRVWCLVKQTDKQFSAYMFGSNVRATSSQEVCCTANRQAQDYICILQMGKWAQYDGPTVLGSTANACTTHPLNSTGPNTVSADCLISASYTTE